jgi:hypothetical protein
MKLRFALSVALAACASGGDTLPTMTEAPRIRTGSQEIREDETEATRLDLISQLVADGFVASKIRVETSVGELGVVRMYTRVEDAYPGAGLRTALIADGRRYGRGSRDLAELARALGWHSKLPPPGDMAALVTFAWLAQMAVDTEVEPTLRRDGDALVLVFGVREALGSDREKVVATIPREGYARLSVRAFEPPEPVVDPISVLELALASDDALAIANALRGLDGVAPSRQRTRAIARAALLPNEALSVDALLRLGNSDEAAEALLEAMSPPADPRHRERTVKRAREVLGEAFAAKLVE